MNGVQQTWADTLHEQIAELQAENDRLRIWKWSENSDDGSHYNPVLSDICKRVGMATGYDWLKLRQAMATAMGSVEREGAWTIDHITEA